MLKDLASDQQRLASFMSELSEEGWSAAWMEGLEFALWEAVAGSRKTFGRLEFSSKHIQQLRSLSEACGGWIIFDDESEETWVPADEWKRRFAARSRRPDL